MGTGKLPVPPAGRAGAAGRPGASRPAGELVTPEYDGLPIREFSV